MDFLVGFSCCMNYTRIAQYVFTNRIFRSKYIIIITITAVCSLLLYIILNKFIDKIILNCGFFLIFQIIIYTNTPKKHYFYILHYLYNFRSKFLLGKRSHTN